MASAAKGKITAFSDLTKVVKLRHGIGICEETKHFSLLLAQIGSISEVDMTSVFVEKLYSLYKKDLESFQLMLLRNLAFNFE